MDLSVIDPVNACEMPFRVDEATMCSSITTKSKMATPRMKIILICKPGKYEEKKQFTVNFNTVRSDVEERVAEERLAWNDKNIPAWPKNISVL